MKRLRGLPSPFVPAAALFATFALAACGGGGGGSSTGGGSVIPPPTQPPPNPTPTPSSTPASNSSSCAGAPCSTYTITSSPSGIGVSLFNGSTTTPIGSTPTTTTPGFVAAGQSIVFSSGYTVPIDQTGNGSHTIYYNQTVDTGNVSVVGAQSAQRAPDSLAAGRSPARARAAAAISTSGLYVRYDASKLQGGRSIARIESDAGASDGRDVTASIAATPGRIVRVAPGSDVSAVAAKLRAEQAVTGVYPLHERTALAASRVTVNDYEFNQTNIQWSLDIVRATYAWSYTKGANAKIAMIDTGVDLTHPDFTGGKVVYQESVINGAVSTASGAAQDTNGHGTNTAGIAAAATNNSVGYAGIGYNASVLAFRIFPQTTASSDAQTANTGDEAIAIADAVSHGADVINLSLGSPQYDPTYGSGYDQAEHDAVEAAINAGVAVVAAAGNESSSAVDFPAAYDGVIAVGASAINDNNTGSLTNATESLASYSNYGAGLTLLAPGGDTGRSSNSSQSDNLHWIINDSTTTANYPSDQCRTVALPDVCGFKFQGTSQATPHVTGAIALIQSALRENGRQTLAPAAMKTLLQGTADNIGDPNQGAGRLNILRAIESALGLPATPGSIPSSSAAQFVAFAYTNSGAVNAAPQIVDVNFPSGIRLGSSGSFRIADIDPSRTSTFRVAVWLDANGDGKIDAGDQFGVASATCSSNARCSIGTITVAPITSPSFALP